MDEIVITIGYCSYYGTWQAAILICTIMCAILPTIDLAVGTNMDQWMTFGVGTKKFELC